MGDFFCLCCDSTHQYPYLLVICFVKTKCFDYLLVACLRQYVIEEFTVTKPKQIPPTVIIYVCDNINSLK